MADFDVIVASGASLQDWLDPASALAPSRLNARAGRPLKRWVGAVNAPIVLKAVVNGIVGPMDAALGGRLFATWPLEAPAQALPFDGVIAAPSQSSVQTLTAASPGHYTIGFRRTGGGLVHVHLDVE